MSINKEFLRQVSAHLAILLTVGLPIQPVLAAVTVGQTASEATVDGIRVPSGTALLSPVTVAANDAGALVHLANGTVVALGPLSSVLVEESGSDIRLAVQQGRVAYTGESGEVEYLSRTETLVARNQGESGRGPRIDTSNENEDLCQLREWTRELWQTCRFDDPDSEDCTWDLIEIPIPEVTNYLEKTAVLSCKDRNDLALECDCNQVAAVLWWIPLATVGGGWALSEVIDKEKKPASPSIP